MTEHLGAKPKEQTAVLALPEKYRKRLRTTNMLVVSQPKVSRTELNTPT